MSSNLFNRVPGIWKSLDTRGILENFLGVVDNDFDRIEGLIASLFDKRTVERIDDFNLYLLSHITGYTWDPALSRLLNRGGIRNAITIHSYKGTWARLSDMLERIGITDWETVDQTSVVMAPGVNGRWGYPDCYWADSDFYHPGARHLIVNHDADEDEIRAELDKVTAAGEKWFISIIVPN
jgi:hypothetical protein